MVYLIVGNTYIILMWDFLVLFDLTVLYIIPGLLLYHLCLLFCCYFSLFVGITLLAFYIVWLLQCQLWIIFGVFLTFFQWAYSWLMNCYPFVWIWLGKICDQVFMVSVPLYSLLPLEPLLHFIIALFGFICDN